jgi:hypothetical protein
MQQKINNAFLKNMVLSFVISGKEYSEMKGQK